eukprot:Opistho-1_new@37540
MSRWLRALVIALLLPAYSLAAVGVGHFVAATADSAEVLIEGHQNPESLADGFADNVLDLMFELGDTSDDAAELPMTAAPLLLAGSLPGDVTVAPDAAAPLNTPDRLLRPPKATARHT